MNKEKLDIIKVAKKALAIESEAIADLIEGLGESFIKSVELLNQCEGKVIVTAVGKSGLIGRKIAATFSSIGTPAFFVHPTEAYHGDLGMITEKDIVIAISNSGQATEILNIIPVIRKIGISVITITGSIGSALAKMSDVVIEVSVDKEADMLNLAPTASTTAVLAMGDAMAVVLQKMKGFREEDFALLHPGGALGRSFLKVEEIMISGSALPVVNDGCTLKEAIIESSEKNLGIVCVKDADDKLRGILTDGDIRRIFLHYDGDELVNTLKESVGAEMIKTPRVVKADSLCNNAVSVMEAKSTYVLPVINEKEQLAGILRMHELVSHGFAIMCDDKA